MPVIPLSLKRGHLLQDPPLSIPSHEGFSFVGIPPILGFLISKKSHRVNIDLDCLKIYDSSPHTCKIDIEAIFQQEPEKLIKLWRSRATCHIAGRVRAQYRQMAFRHRPPLGPSSLLSDSLWLHAILLNPHISVYSMLSLSPTLAPVAAMLSLPLFAKNVPALSLASSILLLDWTLNAKECPNL